MERYRRIRFNPDDSIGAGLNVSHLASESDIDGRSYRKPYGGSAHREIGWEPNVHT